MMTESYKIFSLGIDAVTVEFGSEISLELNDKAIRLARHFEEKPFHGLIETVPAYASLTVFYDVPAVRNSFPHAASAFFAVKTLIENALENLSGPIESEPELVRIPVSFAKECALDLDFVAAGSQLEASEVIDIFLSATYRVFMLGFLPGFAYLGEVSEKIAAPRKKTPRLKVPKGSVGIAGRQTGIYPLDSPGGWQIIGKTEIELFAPEKENPCLLKAGDLVEFYAISE